VPTVLVATEPFAPLARHAAGAETLPDARTVVVAHPLGGVATDGVEARAAGAVEDVLAVLTRRYP
jgi:hypothetical protein